MANSLLQEIKTDIEVLRSPESAREDLVKSLNNIHEVFSSHSGINLPQNVSEGFYLSSPSGQVVSASYAASTLMDPIRTALFFRGLLDAIERIKEKFPDQTPHIFYPGPGPHAPYLAFTAALFSPEEVRFTLLEILPESVEAVKKTILGLGLQDYVENLLMGDAGVYKKEDSVKDIHILIFEVMQKALTREAQVSILRNLVPQIHPEGLVIPHRVELEGVLMNASAELSSPRPGRVLEKKRIPLGRLFTLDAEYFRELYRELGAEKYATLRIFPGRQVQVPDDIGLADQLVVQTRIFTAPDLEIKENDSGLTMPHFEFNMGMTRPGQKIQANYQISQEPGLVYEIEEPAVVK